MTLHELEETELEAFGKMVKFRGIAIITGDKPDVETYHLMRKTWLLACGQLEAEQSARARMAPKYAPLPVVRPLTCQPVDCIARHDAHGNKL